MRNRLTVSAVADGSSLPAPFTAATGPPVRPGTVRTRLARWRQALPDRGVPTIEAADSDPHPSLGVVVGADPSRPPAFTPTNQGGGRYQDQRPWEFTPQTVLAESDFGGIATAKVTP